MEFAAAARDKRQENVNPNEVFEDWEASVSKDARSQSDSLAQITFTRAVDLLWKHLI
jgi:hypothetical protein